MAKQWNIQSGPSKYDLMDALFHRKHHGEVVEMRVQERKGVVSEVRRIEIRAVTQKLDGARDSQLWGFIGSMASVVDRAGYYPGWPRDHFTVIGEYSTSTRTGRLKAIDTDNSRSWRVLKGMLLAVWEPQ